MGWLILSPARSAARPARETRASGDVSPFLGFDDGPVVPGLLVGSFSACEAGGEEVLAARNTAGSALGSGPFISSGGGSCDRITQGGGTGTPCVWSLRRALRICYSAGRTVRRILCYAHCGTS